MPIISTADEATAREVFERSGLAASQLVGSRNHGASEQDAYRLINRSILENVIARVEIEAAGFAGGLGFPLSDSVIAEAHPAWDAAQRTEYAANLLRLLREWAIWLGVAAVRAAAKRSNSDSQNPDNVMEFAAQQAKDIRAALVGELARLAALTADGEAATATTTRGTVVMTRSDGYADASATYGGSEYA